MKNILQQLTAHLFQPKQRFIPCQESTLAGFQFYRGEDIWEFLREGAELYLQREPENPHDNHAISVWFKREKLGYIPKNDNINLARRMDIGQHHQAKIINLIGNLQSKHQLRIVVDMVY